MEHDEQKDPVASSVVHVHISHHTYCRINRKEGQRNSSRQRRGDKRHRGRDLWRSRSGSGEITEGTHLFYFKSHS